jgi:hypothetical protein
MPRTIGRRLYLVVVFSSYEQCGEFLEKAGLPHNRYQSGDDIMRLCGQEVK